MGTGRLLVTTAVVAGLSWAGIAVAGAASVCDEFGGTVQADDICRVQTTTPEYTMKMEFPADVDTFSPKVVDYLRQTRDGFLSVAGSPDAQGLPYELDISTQRFTARTPMGATSSIVFEIYQGVGGAHPSTWYKAFTRPVFGNYTPGIQPLRFEDLFAPDAHALDVIYPAVRADLQRQLGVADMITEDDGTNPENYQDFAITDTDLIFFFSQGELMAQAAGAVEVRLPLSSLPPLVV